MGEHEDEFRREHDVLDVHTARLHLVLHEVTGDRLQGCRLYLAACLDELHRLECLQRVAEVVAHRRLQHFAHQVPHRAHHRDDLGRARVGDMDLHLQPGERIIISNLGEFERVETVRLAD